MRRFTLYLAALAILGCNTFSTLTPEDPDTGADMSTSDMNPTEDMADMADMADVADMSDMSFEPADCGVTRCRVRVSMAADVINPNQLEISATYSIHDSAHVFRTNPAEFGPVDLGNEVLVNSAITRVIASDTVYAGPLASSLTRLYVGSRASLVAQFWPDVSDGSSIINSDGTTDLFAASIVNTEGAQQNFWLEVLDTDEMDESYLVTMDNDQNQIILPVTEFDLDIAEGDSKSTTGSLVLLRDSTGTPYIWDTVQPQVLVRNPRDPVDVTQPQDLPFAPGATFDGVAVEMLGRETRGESYLFVFLDPDIAQNEQTLVAYPTTLITNSTLGELEFEITTDATDEKQVAAGGTIASTQFGGIVYLAITTPGPEDVFTTRFMEWNGQKLSDLAGAMVTDTEEVLAIDIAASRDANASIVLTFARLVDRRGEPTLLIDYLPGK